ncbi:hypothetical protein RRG08_044936 [Elysia crispata]|uniref:Uncharacterized protein n=1 Tax=Elysia crispata TaxID=231223 RepID=A0AAE1DMG9_9GAST|nr:hypothetical protein RRG08_044936 [Elysia crispata]
MKRLEISSDTGNVFLVSTFAANCFYLQRMIYGMQHASSSALSPCDETSIPADFTVQTRAGKTDAQLISEDWEGASFLSFFEACKSGGVGSTGTSYREKEGTRN